MKNKLRRVVMLAIILTLALLAFTGCTKSNRHYNFNDIGNVVISDAVESSLASCVYVDVATVEITGILSSKKHYYTCVGVAITEKILMVPYQAIPKMDSYTKTTYTGLKYGSDTELTFVFKNLDYQLGYALLTLTTATEKLQPIEFADSDNLQFADMLFGVELSIPYVDNVNDIEMKLDKLVRINSVMVSSPTFIAGSLTIGSPELAEATFTCQAYSVVSKPSYEHNFCIFSNYQNVVPFNYINNILFDKTGKFIGTNYMKKVNDSNNNEHVVEGITYAVKSNSIKKDLISKGVLQ